MSCRLSMIMVFLGYGIGFLGRLLSYAIAQNTMAECGPSLLPLAPCAPFVQGMAATPAQSCCDSVDQLYSLKPNCLCVLLNDSTLSSSFPVNRTLALQLPILCNLQIDTSICAGTFLPSHSPPTQVSFGAKPNSSVVAASPTVTASPRSSFTGFGFHQSAEVRLKAEYQFFMLLLAAISILPTEYIE
ncbi:hypothetical protein DH2020_019574 [Rehmannia glutinosa]|uniref:Bifunctional inhibitor/plant lipid transfer protein/seed storage helical domain-containing protein n=1 Tax=Rehmannia glutinosa TaxID=99300 RepID=A0ABR0WQQ0_REHGL